MVKIKRIHLSMLNLSSSSYLSLNSKARIGVELTLRRLASAVLGGKRGHRHTGISIWADFKEKKIIVSFRGTETAKFKDFLVDIQIFQVAYMEGVAVFDGAQVHQGFLRAYKSVQDAILQQLSFIFKAADGISDDSEGNPWRFFITGHSLGGALATLFASDLVSIAYLDSNVLS